MNIKLIIQAIKVKIALNRLSRMKENAVRLHMGLDPIYPWYQTCYINIMKSLREAICMSFCPCCIYDRFRHLKQLKIPSSPWKRIFREGTYENEVLACFLGFLGGVVMTILLYFMMVMQLGFKPLTSSIVCTIAGTISSCGMAFSTRCRCIGLLMVPQLFSSKGRSFIMLYVMILVMTHPVVNFNRNIMVMSNSATCGQQLAYNQTKELVQNAVAPLAGIMGSIRQVLASLQDFSKSLRESFKALKKAVEEISAAIGRVYAWLASIEKVCNDKMGQPYRKCKKAFSDAYTRCENTLVFFLRWLCKIVELVSNLCNIARIGELLCLIASIIKNFVLDTVTRPFRNAITQVYDMFYFNVSIYYKYSFNATQSKSYSQVKEDIMNDVKERLGNFTSMVDIVQFFMMFAVVFVLIKAILYRFKYLTDDKYDNIYITFKVRDIDERRMEIGKESILPLEWKEEGKYITSRSMHMAGREKRKLAKGLVLFVISIFHAGFYMACDSGLYWLLNMMKEHLSIKTHANVPPHLKMHVQGKGALADMYRALLTMFDPLAEGNVKIDTAPCLPKPYTPNFAVYDEIGVLFGICMFLIIFEAYGLRLRHIIAGCYYPERERARAVWLYNHIIKMRGGFLKFARRQLRRKFIATKNTETISIRGRLAAQFPIARKIFKYLGWNRKSCLSCGKEGREEDEDNFTHCMNNDCDAVYCMECFTDLNNLCTVCMDPIDYGDFSDFSEERDSSEDEEEMLKRKLKANRRKERLRKQQEEKTPDKQMKGFRLLLGLTDSKIQEQADIVRENYMFDRGFDDYHSDNTYGSGSFSSLHLYGIGSDGDHINAKAEEGDIPHNQPANREAVMKDIRQTKNESESEENYDHEYQYQDKLSNTDIRKDFDLYDQNDKLSPRRPSNYDLVTEDIFEMPYNDNILDLSLSEPEDIEIEREIADTAKIG